MRRFGGIVLALALAVAGCATSGDVSTSRSTAAPPASAFPTTTIRPTAEAPSTTSTSVAPNAPESAAAAAKDNPIPRGTATAVTSSQAPAPPSGPQPTGHIEIPAIGLSHATYEGIDLSIINYGPSHWPGTAMPGHKGNTVFPGHRTTYTRPFWDIDLLVPGDQVIFTTAEGRFVYEVTDTMIVGEYDSWIVEETPNATFTIFGCHPKGSARQRYVAKGALVSSPATTTTTTTAPPRTTTTTTTEPEDDGILGPFFD